MHRQPSDAVDNTLVQEASPPKPRFALRIGMVGQEPINLSETSLSSVHQQLSKVLYAIEHVGHGILKDEPDVYDRKPSEFRLVCRVTRATAQLVSPTVPKGWLIESVLVSTEESADLSSVDKDASNQIEFTGYLTSHSVVRFATASNQTEAQTELNAINYSLRQIDLLIAIWNGAATPGADETAAVARRAFESGVPVVWISTAGRHPPRLLVDFDENGNALAPETDCTEGPLASALRLIVGGPKATIDGSGVSPREGLQNFYSESWHTHCYSTVYDFFGVLRPSVGRVS
jgi:hypothetical protein